MTRLFWSTVDARRRTFYTCRILAAADDPPGKSRPEIPEDKVRSKMISGDAAESVSPGTCVSDADVVPVTETLPAVGSISDDFRSGKGENCSSGCTSVNKVLYESSAVAFKSLSCRDQSSANDNVTAKVEVRQEPADSAADADHVGVKKDEVLSGRFLLNRSSLDMGDTGSCKRCCKCDMDGKYTCLCFANSDSEGTFAECQKSLDTDDGNTCRSLGCRQHSCETDPGKCDASCRAKFPQFGSVQHQITEATALGNSDDGDKETSDIRPPREPGSETDWTVGKSDESRRLRHDTFGCIQHCPFTEARSLGDGATSDVADILHSNIADTRLQSDFDRSPPPLSCVPPLKLISQLDGSVPDSESDDSDGEAGIQLASDDVFCRRQLAGPFKCAKCRRVYRTAESCALHSTVCTFELSSSSGSSDWDGDEGLCVSDPEMDSCCSDDDDDGVISDYLTSSRNTSLANCSSLGCGTEAPTEDCDVNANCKTLYSSYAEVGHFGRETSEDCAFESQVTLEPSSCGAESMPCRVANVSDLEDAYIRLDAARTTSARSDFEIRVDKQVGGVFVDAGVQMPSNSPVRSVSFAEDRCRAYSSGVDVSVQVDRVGDVPSRTMDAAGQETASRPGARENSGCHADWRPFKSQITCDSSFCGTESLPHESDSKGDGGELDGREGMEHTAVDQSIPDPESGHCEPNAAEAAAQELLVNPVSGTVFTAGTGISLCPEQMSQPKLSTSREPEIFTGRRIDQWYCSTASSSSPSTHFRHSRNVSVEALSGSANSCCSPRQFAPSLSVFVSTLQSELKPQDVLTASASMVWPSATVVPTMVRDTSSGSAVADTGRPYPQPISWLAYRMLSTASAASSGGVQRAATAAWLRPLNVAQPVCAVRFDPLRTPSLVHPLQLVPQVLRPVLFVPMALLAPQFTLMKAVNLRQPAATSASASQPLFDSSLDPVPPESQAAPTYRCPFPPPRCVNSIDVNTAARQTAPISEISASIRPPLVNISALLGPGSLAAPCSATVSQYSSLLSRSVAVLPPSNPAGPSLQWPTFSRSLSPLVTSSSYPLSTTFTSSAILTPSPKRVLSSNAVSLSWPSPANLTAAGINKNQAVVSAGTRVQSMMTESSMGVARGQSISTPEMRKLCNPLRPPNVGPSHCGNRISSHTTAVAFSAVADTSVRYPPWCGACGSALPSSYVATSADSRSIAPAPAGGLPLVGSHAASPRLGIHPSSTTVSAPSLASVSSLLSLYSALCRTETHAATLAAPRSTQLCAAREVLVRTSSPTRSGMGGDVMRSVSSQVDGPSAQLTAAADTLPDQADLHEVTSPDVVSEKKSLAGSYLLRFTFKVFFCFFLHL